LHDSQSTEQEKEAAENPQSAGKVGPGPLQVLDD
jgi:hypothetical protein